MNCSEVELPDGAVTIVVTQQNLEAIQYLLKSVVRNEGTMPDKHHLYLQKAGEVIGKALTAGNIKQPMNPFWGGQYK
jgi:hypothetical protein